MDTHSSCYRWGANTPVTYSSILGGKCVSASHNAHSIRQIHLRDALFTDASWVIEICIPTCVSAHIIIYWRIISTCSADPAISSDICIFTRVYAFWRRVSLRVVTGHQKDDHYWQKTHQRVIGDLAWRFAFDLCRESSTVLCREPRILPSSVLYGGGGPGFKIYNALWLLNFLKFILDSEYSSVYCAVSRWLVDWFCLGLTISCWSTVRILPNRQNAASYFCSSCFSSSVWHNQV